MPASACCPHDQTIWVDATADVTVDVAADVTVDEKQPIVCPECRGRWVAKPVLAASAQRVGFSVDAYFYHLDRYRVTSNGLVCPAGCGVMSTAVMPTPKVKPKQVELDWCEQCSGTWFDHQEYSTLITHYSHRDDSVAVDVLCFIGDLVGAL